MSEDADRPLRVGLVYEGDISADEGVAHYVRTLAFALHGSGHVVHVFTSGPRPQWGVHVSGAHGLSRNVRVRVNGNRVSVPWRASRGSVRSAMTDAALDVLHIHVPHSPRMTGAMLRHVAPSTAVVATFHMSASRAPTTLATRVTEPAKFGLLAAADVACFPASEGESFGVVLLEAMAAGGCVVLAGGNPGYRGVLDDHPELLVDPRNVQAVAERLATLLEDRALRQRLCA